MFFRALLIGVAATCAACSSKPLPSSVANDAGAEPDADASAPSTRTITVLDGARISSDSSAPNFQIVSADVDFSGGPYSSAILRVDLGTTCFPFSSWQNDEPPAGQNYPADCDAFDRNFEIALDDPAPDSGAGPGLELVRAITPFGGPLHVEQDVTALVSALAGSHHLSARINTYPDPAGLISGSNGGWNVTVKLALVSGVAPRRPLAVVPLFYGDMTTTDAATASFTTPPGTTSAYVEYRTTGHGQAAGEAPECVGPAEEFCKREHTVQLDGATLETFTPWRVCANACTLVSEGDAGFQYCVENPCGDIASVKAPRANWCPGSESLPIILDEPELAVPGPHDLSWQVSQIVAGGIVRVSLTYYAFGD